jgi:hypothetical protein
MLAAELSGWGSALSPAVLRSASFAVLLAGALQSTNGLEWFGSKLNLGQGAIGSVLAAIATALPESLITVVGIFGGSAGSDDVATGCDTRPSAAACHRREGALRRLRADLPGQGARLQRPLPDARTRPRDFLTTSLAKEGVNFAPARATPMDFLQELFG